MDDLLWKTKTSKKPTVTLCDFPLYQIFSIINFTCRDFSYQINQRLYNQLWSYLRCIWWNIANLIFSSYIYTIYVLSVITMSRKRVLDKVFPLSSELFNIYLPYALLISYTTIKLYLWSTSTVTKYLNIYPDTEKTLFKNCVKVLSSISSANGNAKVKRFQQKTEKSILHKLA